MSYKCDNYGCDQIMNIAGWRDVFTLSTGQLDKDDEPRIDHFCSLECVRNFTDKVLLYRKQDDERKKKHEEFIFQHQDHAEYHGECDERNLFFRTLEDDGNFHTLAQNVDGTWSVTDWTPRDTTNSIPVHTYPTREAAAADYFLFGQTPNLLHKDPPSVCEYDYPSYTHYLRAQGVSGAELYKRVRMREQSKANVTDGLP